MAKSMSVTEVDDKFESLVTSGTSNLKSHQHIDSDTSILKPSPSLNRQSDCSRKIKQLFTYLFNRDFLDIPSGGNYWNVHR